jgi:hypothetical protein
VGAPRFGRLTRAHCLAGPNDPESPESEKSTISSPKAKSMLYLPLVAD